MAVWRRFRNLGLAYLIIGAAGCALQEPARHPDPGSGLQSAADGCAPLPVSPPQVPVAPAVAPSSNIQTVAALEIAADEAKLLDLSNKDGKATGQVEPKKDGKPTGQGETTPAVLPDAPPGPPETPVIPAPAHVMGIDLPAALAMGGAENPTIAIAQVAVSLALAQQQEACALLLPNLNAGIDYDRHDGVLQTSSGIMLTVDRQSMYFGAGAGAIGAGSVFYPGVELNCALTDAIFAPAAAKQEVVNRRFEAAATNNLVLLDVGVLYYALVGAESRLAAMRQSELEFGEIGRLTAEQARAGQGIPADADRARSETLLVHRQEQALEEEVAVASARLAQLLNVDPSTRLQSKPGPGQVLVLADPHPPLETLLQTALDNRPEMKAQAAAIAAAEARYRQECFRPFLPTLFVGYSYGNFGGGSNLVSTTFGNFNNRTDVDAVAYWTLEGAGLGNLALQKRRRAEVNEAQADLSITVNRIRDEVAEASANAAAREQALAVARRQLVRARDGMRRDYLRVRGLEGRPIEVINSTRLLAAARQEFVAALTQYNQAQLQLFVYLGQPPTLAPPPLNQLPLPEAPGDDVDPKKETKETK